MWHVCTYVDGIPIRTQFNSTQTGTQYIKRFCIINNNNNDNIKTLLKIEKRISYNYAN